MKLTKNILIIILYLVVVSCNSPQEEKIPKSTNLSAKEIYAMTVNKTVTIITENSLGSGFFIDSNIIITNYHVIKDANKAEVVLNNSDKKYLVKGYLAVDKINDLVLLQTSYLSKDFIIIEDKIPQPGEKVFAIGSPVGLSKTISEGIVSGVRDFGDKKLLQITAPISHGSSGCPIINEQGKLVGVAVSGVEEGNNIGFCIPSNFIKTLLDFKSSYIKDLITLSTTEIKKDVEKTIPTNPKTNEEKPKKAKSKDISSSKKDDTRSKSLAYAFFNSGKALYEIGAYKDAIREFTSVIELVPKEGAAYTFRGSCKLLLGNEKEACLDWAKAVELGEIGVEKELINKYCN